jgi:hypothetical protein
MYFWQIVFLINSSVVLWYALLLKKYFNENTAFEINFVPNMDSKQNSPFDCLLVFITNE